MNNGLGFQLANVPTITGLASVNANEVTTDTIEVSTLTIDGVDIETSLNDKVSKTLNNTVTGINTFSNPANVFYGDGANLTGISSSTVLLSNTATGATNYLVMSSTASGISSLLTDNSGATYNSTNNTAAINISGTASYASQVTLSNTASGATNYLIMSPVNSGTSSLFTDNAGATYDSTTNTAAINISGKATQVELSNTASGATNYLVMSATNSGTSSLLTDNAGATYDSTTNTAAINISGTAATPANMVTTDTIQTITAKKTFNTDLLVATDMNIGHGNNSLSSNVCFGTGTLANITTAGEQVAIGVNALNAHNGANGNNVAISSYTLSLGTNPYNSIAIGRSALYKATAGSYNNICIGADSGRNFLTAYANICIGASMDSCTSGAVNIAIGENALLYTNGLYNVAIGTGAGLGSRRSQGTYVGANSGLQGQQADRVCAVGYNALFNNSISGTVGHGNDCTGIGHNAGGTNQKVGINNTFIGSATDIDTLGNWNNSTAIGYGAIITANNQIKLGRSSETVQVDGNLTVAGTFTGTVTNATNATNAVNVGITNVPTDTNIHYLTFSQFTSGNRPLRVSNGKLTYQPDTNSLQCINNTTGVGDIRTGYLTLADSLNEFIIDLISSNVRMYQGTVSKDIHFDFYDGTLDKTTFTSSLTTTTISPSGTTALTITGASSIFTNEVLSPQFTLGSVANPGAAVNAGFFSQNTGSSASVIQNQATSGKVFLNVRDGANALSTGLSVSSSAGVFSNEAVGLQFSVGGITNPVSSNNAGFISQNTGSSATVIQNQATSGSIFLNVRNATNVLSTPLSVSSSAVSIVPLTTFTQNNIILNTTNNFNVGYGAGGTSNTIIGRTVARTVAFGTGNNTIIGAAAGAALNSTARDTTLIGVSAGDGITTGNFNTHIGSNSGNQASGTGDNNTSCGYIALGSLITTGANNSAFGYSAGYQISTGQNNTCLGYGAGVNITTGGSNIMIGSGASGTAAAQNQIVIGTTAETMYIQGGFNWRVGTQITASINLSTAVLAQFYSVAMAAASQTITLPNPTTAAYLGARVTFKRKTNTTAFNLAAAGTTPFLGVSTITAVASPTSIGVGIFQVDMVCDGVNWCFISTA